MVIYFFDNTATHILLGFASYDNAEAASQAVSMMNGLQTFGKRLKVELKKGDEGFGPVSPGSARR